jgi:hypothetical protein
MIINFRISTEEVHVLQYFPENWNAAFHVSEQSRTVGVNVTDELGDFL